MLLNKDFIYFLLKERQFEPFGGPALVEGHKPAALRQRDTSFSPNTLVFWGEIKQKRQFLALKDFAPVCDAAGPE